VGHEYRQDQFLQEAQMILSPRSVYDRWVVVKKLLEEAQESRWALQRELEELEKELVERPLEG
jgi:hypothetical protein